jgi:uncharacterized protein YheU (UPF0270 family)
MAGTTVEQAPEPVEVPYTELREDVLHAVIESFVLREGTDYGEKEYSLQDKVARILIQLKQREAKIVYDPESDSVTIVVAPRSK